MKTLIVRFVLLATLMALAIPANGQMRSNKFGVGLSGSYFLVQTDFDSGEPSFGGGVELSYSMIEYLSIRSSLGFGFLQAKNDAGGPSLNSTVIFGNIYLAADLDPNGSFNPFIFVGGSGMYFDARQGDGTALTGAGVKQMKGTLVGGVGFDIFASEFLSFTVAGEMGLPVSDRIDGVTLGDKKDSFQRISLGLRYYFFDQDFITRMLKALEERYK
ncbi:MAG TPA: outer membrane beta-barrel protein [Bacteroidota bacterium]